MKADGLGEAATLALSIAFLIAMLVGLERCSSDVWMQWLADELVRRFG